MSRSWVLLMKTFALNCDIDGGWAPGDGLLVSGPMGKNWGPFLESPGNFSGP